MRNIRLDGWLPHRCPRRMPHFVHHSHTLFYREQGRGPLLIILPGNTASSACYEGELEYFSRHYHAVSFDFQGTGSSERLEQWPDDWWEKAVYDVAGLIEHLGEERAVLVGTSGGAVIALLTAILLPKRARAVVADSCLERYPAALLRMVVAERTQRTDRQIAFWQLAHGDDWEQVVEADSERLRHIAAQGDLDWAQGRLRKIACPTLLTASLCDKSLPDVGQKLCRMAEQIPHCRVFLMNAGEHPLMWSRRADFFPVCTYFLKDVLKNT
ncbi:hypothetical protein CSA56_00690 [candidate division KSB3 bacterium]|uniref:AB hydrolase-1 domain-containing protein n=1 Tax=candidate division KSB3 bacterium TaxID=2044937 RepID=A0A2G6KKQ3_9BACT|nr:MAG: hypothetical protein CSA56_00690 [candidate division KSB3 bacterium]